LNKKAVAVFTLTSYVCNFAATKGFARIEPVWVVL